MFRISIHPLFNFSFFFFFFLTEGLVLASSVCWTLTGSMLPSACEMFPLAATQPQSMMAPRPQNSNFNQACSRLVTREQQAWQDVLLQTSGAELLLEDAGEVFF